MEETSSLIVEQCLTAGAEYRKVEGDKEVTLRIACDRIVRTEEERLNIKKMREEMNREKDPKKKLEYKDPTDYSVPRTCSVYAKPSAKWHQHNCPFAVKEELVEARTLNPLKASKRASKGK